MKVYRKVMRIYLKSTFSPILAGFAVAMTLGTLVLLLFTPADKGSDDYASMMGFVFISHIGITMFNVTGNLVLMRDKFYTSLPEAKKLYTVAPVAATVVPGIIYDIILTVLTAMRLGADAASDALIFAAAGCMVNSIFISVNGKKKMLALDFLMILSFSLGMPLISGISALNNGLGVSLYAAVVIAAAIYLFTVVFCLFILRWLWDKDERINKNMGMIVNGNTM